MMQDIFSKMKAENGEDVIILFKLEDCYEAYNQDAIKLSEILGVETPQSKLSFPQNEKDDIIKNIFDAGLGVLVSETIGKDGKAILPWEKQSEVLNQYED